MPRRSSSKTPVVAEETGSAERRVTRGSVQPPDVVPSTALTPKSAGRGNSRGKTDEKKTLESSTAAIPASDEKKQGAHGRGRKKLELEEENKDIASEAATTSAEPTEIEHDGDSKKVEQEEKPKDVTSPTAAETGLSQGSAKGRGRPRKKAEALGAGSEAVEEHISVKASDDELPKEQNELKGRATRAAARTPVASPTPLRSTRGRRSAKTDNEETDTAAAEPVSIGSDDQDTKSPAKKKARILAPEATVTKPEEESITGEEIVMDTELTETKDENKSSTDQVDAVDETNFAELCGYVVIGSGDVPSATSAEVLHAVANATHKDGISDAVVAPETSASLTSPTLNPDSDKVMETPGQAITDIVSNGESSVEQVESKTLSESPTVNGNLPDVHSVPPDVIDSSDHVVDKNNESTQSSHQAVAVLCPSLPDVLFSRQWLTNPRFASTVEVPTRSFTVVSYNILADYHAGRDFAVAPWLKPGEWQMSVRHDRLMKELMYLEADVICLQEVGADYFSASLLPAMRQMGYDGIYFPRQHNYKEGEATFYRTNRFTLDSKRCLSLGKELKQEIDASSLEADLTASVKSAVECEDVAILTRLKLISEPGSSSSRFVCIANIHCVWDRLERQDKQCLQLAHTMRELIKMTDSIHPHIICGDFNAWRGSAPYQLVQDGQLTEDNLMALQGIGAVPQPDGQLAPLVDYWSDGFQFTPCNMQSAYFTVTGDEPLTSRFNTDGAIRGVDYIWYSADLLDVTGVLKTVDGTLLKNGAPSHQFPSDHLSLKAKLVFK